MTRHGFSAAWASMAHWPSSSLRVPSCLIIVHGHGGFISPHRDSRVHCSCCLPRLHANAASTTRRKPSACFSLGETLPYALTLTVLSRLPDHSHPLHLHPHLSSGHGETMLGYAELWEQQTPLGAGARDGRAAVAGTAGADPASQLRHRCNQWDGQGQPWGVEPRGALLLLLLLLVAATIAATLPPMSREHRLKWTSWETTVGDY